MCRSVQIREWWWPLGPKLVFEQMVAAAPEIMVISGMLNGIRDHFCCQYNNSDRELPVV
jgi:hypothetical protein